MTTRPPFFRLCLPLLAALPAGAASPPQGDTAAGGVADALGPLVLTLVGAAVAVLRWLVKRELAALEARLGARLAPTDQAAIDAAIDRAAEALETLLDGIADRAVRTRLAPALAASEAESILRYLPKAAEALGLTRDAVAARIAAALGDPLKPTEGASP